MSHPAGDWWGVKWCCVRLIVVVLTATLVPLTGVAQEPRADPPPCRCGPAPGYPSWFCADGRHQGGRGPCVQRTDGSCGWMRLVCPEDRAPAGAPATCSPAECGAPPAGSAWSCPGSRDNGSFGACKRDREGRCGWVHQPCRGRAQQVADVKPRVRPRPEPPTGMRSCVGLPRTDEVRTWPVVGVCRPGGGPAPAPLARLKSLGDGTFIFS